MPIVLICVIIFAVILKYKLRSVERTEKKQEEDFLQMERKASLPVKRDLGTLPLLSISLESLPFQDNASGKLATYQTIIRELSTQNICNLIGISNTHLKLKYGAGNLELLSTYEQNYILLIQTLTNWGIHLSKNQAYQESKMVLEYAVSCNSDMRQTYITLARIYKKEDQIDKIYELLSQVESMSTTLDLKKAIYGVLNEYED